MTIVSVPNAVVAYTFVGTDLEQPGGFPFTGKIEYVVQVTYSSGNVLTSGDIGALTVKEGVT